MSIDTRRLKQIIADLPPAAIPEVLSCIVKHSVQKKVFGERSVASVVRTLENVLKGIKGSADQSSQQG